MPELLRVLFVCTGNICRSPMAEGLARAAVERDYPSLSGRISLGSAGVAGLDGEPPTAEAVIAMRERRIDISSHTARSTSSSLLSRCDLVLVMEESHRRYLEPTAGPGRVFLLLKFAEACRAWGRENAGRPPEPRSRLASVVETMERMEAGGLWEKPEYAYEVADPLGMRLAEYVWLTEALAGPVEEVIRALLGRPRPIPGR